MQIEPRSGIPEISELADSRAFAGFSAIAAVIALVFVVYWQTSVSMVSTWARSDTFAHGFLVVPAALWMVWTSRTRLAALEASPWWPGLIPLAGAGFLWLVGELASALALAQWSMVAMVPCAVLTMFGRGWLRVLALPMAFLFFAVPIGEVFVPTLIDWTADFTVAALAASGIPVFREGPHFVIPSGRWSVVEACSGIRYLIASIVVGVLYAWSMYRSPMRRTLFIVASAVVPLVANWLRAYLIVLLGHLSDNRIAAGVDHLIYGWVFFGFVLALVFLIGATWREDDGRKDYTREYPTVYSSVLKSRMAPPVSMAIVAALAIGIWPVALDGLRALGDTRPIEPATLAANGGWIETKVPAADWRPTLEGPAQSQLTSFTRAGSTVSVFIGFYRDQRQGRELVNSMNRLLPDLPGWQQIASGRSDERYGDTPSTVRTATLRSATGTRIRTWQWYWIDGEVTISDARAKLSLAFARLLGRSDTSAWLAVFTVADGDVAADRVLGEFMRDMAPALDAALAAAAAR